MKITDIEAIVVKQPDIKMIGDGSQDTVVIKVHTDEGITGIGEVDSSPYVVKAIIETPPSHMVCIGLKDAVIGEDPFDVEKIWNKMYRLSYYYGRRSAAIHAMSGIDIAIWDIIGKVLNKPIYKLIGGSYRDKITAYCSLLMPETEDEVKKIVNTYMPMGFQGIKFGWGSLGKDRYKDISLVKTARNELGDKPYLMIDMGMVWKDAKSAIQMCNRFSEYGVYWVEEPFTPDNKDAYKRLSQSVDMRIAAGEELGTIYEFKEFIEECGIDIVQPDLSRCGGITIAKKVLDLANYKSLPVIPHAFKTGILMSASLQLIANMPYAPFLEYCSQETVLSKNLIKNHFTIDSGGYVHMPEGPGLGIEIDEDVLEKYSVRI